MMPLFGRKAAVGRLKALAGKDAESVVAPALFAAGELIAVEAQLSISRGSVSGKDHVPSAPGQPPNYDTGHLSDNIVVTQPRPSLVHVSSNAEYSAALEFGTSRMEARPFMRPARDKMKGEAQALVARAFSRFVKSTKKGSN